MYVTYRQLLLIAISCCITTTAAHSQKIPAKASARTPSTSAIAKQKRQSQLNRALFEATKYGNVARMAELIKLGADVNANDGFNPTAIFLAIRSKSLPALKLLISRKANVNIEITSSFLDLEEELNNDITDSMLNMAPLDLATYTNQIEMVKVLLNAGAKSPKTDCETPKNGRIAGGYAGERR